MHTSDLTRWQHDHHFTVVNRSNEQRIVLVVVIAGITMVVEIASGALYGSMALLAD